VLWCVPAEMANRNYSDVSDKHNKHNIRKTCLLGDSKRRPVEITYGPELQSPDRDLDSNLVAEGQAELSECPPTVPRGRAASMSRALAPSDIGKNSFSSSLLRREFLRRHAILLRLPDRSHGITQTKEREKETPRAHTSDQCVTAASPGNSFGVETPPVCAPVDTSLQRKPNRILPHREKSFVTPGAPQLRASPKVQDSRGLATQPREWQSCRSPVSAEDGVRHQDVTKTEENHTDFSKNTGLAVGISDVFGSPFKDSQKAAPDLQPCQTLRYSSPPVEQMSGEKENRLVKGKTY